MKNIIALCFAVFAASSFALDKLPEGNWTGKGTFYGEKAGEKGTYEEKLTIKDNVMTSELKAGDQKFVYVVKAEFKANDFLGLTIEEKGKTEIQKGHGYCGSVWCHWQSDDNKIELTLVFAGKQVYEIGSDLDKDGKRSRFESVLNYAKPE